MKRLVPEEIYLNLPDSDIVYYPDFLERSEADSSFDLLYKETPWQQDHISVFGKRYAQPRLTALYGNNGKPYSYSNLVMLPHAYTDTLLKIKKKVEAQTETSFTSCLLNLYRNGQDSNGWHADNEKELGKHPIIASVSLGQERFFHLKHRTDKSLKQKLLLQHGSLLLMKGPTQEAWLHQIPKTAKPIGARINLTFRIIT
ncbi:MULTISPECIES: alpha-ketoglutarate-dependent dioxygenase AlkB family protein [Zobellia]|uniref:Alpha-ketoglutarate-dependent dioxygenase n=1 Tax=Zobellia galactanivorans (strain DSM 12802 / CCUG 47099 / CIP 106680 / NCIMB 13871 / Dsij) TaxID=63186 RepID=G0L1H2_ZOBGA|nr:MULTISPECIES: alpha-ketoglutarate-dependent dioxygenase AlkB [Zobellia]MBU3026878.1 alpha-ketoglutarate-dependent dioxygenase AlkB [Zobellia galactanivorans]OWW23732.1 alpha-ketoglutarate-dependent dioxygenase AlkB [Zobellia sp. OII3]CAZ94688.1 Alpha-ketoglutarate-dependent dioxygenase [Zobellia galactanivorans]